MIFDVLKVHDIQKVFMKPSGHTSVFLLSSLKNILLRVRHICDVERQWRYSNIV